MSPSPLPPPFPPTPIELWKQRLGDLFLRHPWLVVASILVPALVGGILIYGILRLQRTEVHHLAGYVSEVETLQAEYAHFQGQPLQAEGIRRDFGRAAAWADRGDYRRALQQLDALAKQAPLPVIFNDLGVLYEELHDPRHAIHAFREALARDPNYAPVRANLDRFKSLTSQIADPLATEVEPNDSLDLANPVAIDQPVEAEIKDTTDVDYFRFTTPPAPRDRVQISIQNRSRTLAARLRIYDRQELLMPLGREAHEPGASFDLIFSPDPSSTFYVNVFGDKDSFGAYTLTIRTLKSFDRFEPNDDIYSARRIAVGETIDANIMDGDDTDFYSFEAPRNGTMSVEIQNHSSVLIPVLTTFTPDMRTNGFSADVPAGAPVHHTFPVQQGQIYYLQVWSQLKTSGDYSLMVR